MSDPDEPTTNGAGLVPEPPATELDVGRGGSGEDGAPLLYQDLVAPEPADPDPPPAARWLAFAAILVAGLLGGLIGYGTADLLSESSLIVGLGGIAGAAIGAVGVGVVAGLTLRAMNEWRSVSHPEGETRASSGLIVRPAPVDPEPGPGTDSDPAEGSGPEGDRA